MKLLLAMLALAATAAATSQDYVPDVYEFDGSNALTFDPAPQMSLAAGGTIEFWVAPDWTEDPGYDPTIIANAGPEGASYLVAMLRDRDGLAFVSGVDEDVVTFDFADGQLHHVALSQLEDGVVVIVDGQVVGVTPLMAGDLPSTGIWIGTLDGEANPFTGALAGLRVWSVPIEREVLVEYALKDIFDNDHPDLESLTAMSDFNTGELLLVDAVSSADVAHQTSK
jgi:hypothetical protein